MSLEAPTTLDEVKSALGLSKEDSSKRYIGIRKGKGKDATHALICVNLGETFPMLSLPQEVLRSNSIVDLDVVTKTTNTDFTGTILENVTFDEFFLQEDVKPNIPKALYDELKRERRTIGTGVDLGTRYKAVCTVKNIISSTTFIIILDGLYGDLFIIPGLDYILDSTVVFKNNTDIVRINGYSIGSYTSPKIADRSFPIMELLTNYIGSSPIKNIKSDLLLPNAKAYFVPCNKDYVHSVNGNIMPIIYDKIQIPAQNREIQMSKYPLLILEFGVADDIVDNDANRNSIKTFLMYMDNLNMVSVLRNNADKYLDNTVFGIAIPCF